MSSIVPIGEGEGNDLLDQGFKLRIVKNNDGSNFEVRVDQTDLLAPPLSKINLKHKKHSD